MGLLLQLLMPFRVWCFIQTECPGPGDIVEYLLLTSVSCGCCGRDCGAHALARNPLARCVLGLAVQSNRVALTFDGIAGLDRVNVYVLHTHICQGTSTLFGIEDPRTTGPQGLASASFDVSVSDIFRLTQQIMESGSAYSSFRKPAFDLVEADRRGRCLMHIRSNRSSRAIKAEGSAMQVRVEDADLLTDYERKRKEYRERNRIAGKREASTLDMLRSFRSKLASAAPSPEEPLAASTAAARPEDTQVRTTSFSVLDVILTKGCLPCHCL